MRYTTLTQGFVVYNRLKICSFLQPWTDWLVRLHFNPPLLLLLEYPELCFSPELESPRVIALEFRLFPKTVYIYCTRATYSTS